MRAMIATFTGQLIDVLDPSPSMIELADIAHALSLSCRWGGHCHRFYSLAEHSVRVSFEAEALAREAKFEQHLIERVALEGLMHDADEAYPPGDMAAPLKQWLAAYQRDGVDVVLEVQREIRKAIVSRFGLGDELPELVHRADRILLATEARDLMATEWMPDGAEPQRHKLAHTWTAMQAELAFVARFQELHTDSVLPVIERLLPERWLASGDDPLDNRYPTAYQRDDSIIMRMLLVELERCRHAVE